MISRLMRNSGMSAVALVAALLAAMVVAPALAQERPPIAIGPYVQNVGADNATICWATWAGHVGFSPATRYTDNARAYQHHKVLLRNLKPGTTYTYDIRGDGSDVGKGTFTTVPEGDHSFTFVVLGDTQGDQGAHRYIVRRVIAEKPDLVFNTGDLTSDGRDLWRWATFFRVSGDLMRSVPYYPAYGNHEGDTPYFLDFLSPPGVGRYYSFNRGGVHFVVLDTPGLYMPDDNQAVTQAEQQRFVERREQYWQRQMQWLKDDLAGHRDAKYVFVFFHYPLYTVNAMPGYVIGARQMREAFGTVFHDYGVTAVFNGHDHQYHHALAGGVHFVVAGPAGGSPRPLAPLLPETVKAATGYCFVRVKVAADKAVVRIIGIRGDTVDEFELRPRAARRVH